MGRPRKQTVDQFLHDVHHGKTIRILEKKWQNDGYAFWFKLLENLCNAPGHYLCFDKDHEDEWQFFIDDALVDEGTGGSILGLLSKMETIDEELWTKNRIVWSQNLVDRIAPVYKKRSEQVPERPKGSKPTKLKEDKEEKEEPPSEETSKTPSINKESKDILARESKFKTDVMAFADKYPMLMLFTEGDTDSIQDRRSFFGYWTERNSGGKSMAFEKQKTFDIARRLATWANNQKDFSSKPSSGRATYGGHESERIGDVYLGPAPDGVE